MIVSDLFPPGFKGGGPTQTIANLVAHCRPLYDFFVITRDTDFGEKARYTGIRPDEWIEKYGCTVNYLSVRNRSLLCIRNVLRSIEYDLLYLQSIFSKSTIKVLLLRRLGLLAQAPVVLAPRGELLPNAIQHRKMKMIKKHLFLRLAKLCGLYRALNWQATSEAERAHLRQYFSGKIHLAPNLPMKMGAGQGEPNRERQTKKAGRADLIFLARITPVKNLDFALDVLRRVRGEVSLHIYGPIEKGAYWSQCQTQISRMPANIRVTYAGVIAHEQVIGTFGRHHFFLLPTRTENFGHVILESISAGCPVVISDRTPWRDLQAAGAGWDLPLEDPGAFRKVLQRCVDMGPEEYDALVRRTLEYGRSVTAGDEAVEQTRRMFDQAISDYRRGRTSTETGVKAT